MDELRKRKNYTDEEMLKWYDLVQEFRKKYPIFENGHRSPRMTRFCKSYRIAPKKLQWFNYRFYYFEQSNPALYKENVDIAVMYRESGLSKIDFCTQFKVNMNKLVAADQHLLYRERITDLLKKREEAANMCSVRSFLDEKLQAETKQEPSKDTPYAFLAITPELAQEKQQEKQKVLLRVSNIEMSVDPSIGGARLIKLIEFLETF